MQARLNEAEERPILTIAIPTYNRSGLLSQLLDNLREQIVGDPRVHLLISDNASTDDTVKVVEEERRRGTRLDYLRNSNNVGAERNFLQCYERAATKYLWIISDDDLLCPGTVPRVLDYLSEDEYEVVFIASGGFYSDRPPEKPKGYAKKALVCTDSARFLRRVHVFTTLISSNIINKDRVEAIGHKPFSTLVGSGLVQLGWTYTALRGHRRSLYIGEKLVLYRLANTGGYELCRVFGANLMDITENWLGVPRLNKLVMNGTLQRFFPRFWSRANCPLEGIFRRTPVHSWESCLAIIFGTGSLLILSSSCPVDSPGVGCRLCGLLIEWTAPWATPPWAGNGATPT